LDLKRERERKWRNKGIYENNSYISRNAISEIKPRSVDGSSMLRMKKIKFMQNFSKGM